MSKLKRTLAVLLAAVMILGMLPVMTSAATYTTGEIVTNKSYDATTGMLTLEAYATGESQVVETVQPIDVVLVLDVSGSMDDPFGTDTYAYVETYNIVNGGRYYYYNEETGSYERAYFCRKQIWFNAHPDNTWWTEEHITGIFHGGEQLFPKTSSDSEGTQFYTLTQYSQTKLDALKSAAKGFIDLVSQKSADSNIAIVKFAGNKTNDVGNDTYYDSDDYEYYNYSQIVMDLTSADTNSDTLKSTIDSLEPAGATRADYGMAHAETILSNANNQGHAKVVVMFTDGSPTSTNGFENAVANSAISTSSAMKAGGVTVYTIGCFNNADSSQVASVSAWNNLSNVNKYMNLVSSNFNSNATGMNANFNHYTYGGYYKTASSSSELKSVFTTISEEIGGTAVTLTETAVMKDVVSEYFDIPKGATVTAHTETCTAIDAKGNPTAWQRMSDDVDLIPVIDHANKTVTVTGFNYSENWVGSHNGVAGGKRVVLQIQIADNGTGFGVVPTNTDKSGIYENASATKPTETFKIPQTEFPYYTVKHVQGETVKSTENVRMSGTGNLTALVSKNYLYAGAFSSEACDTVYPFSFDKGENGLSFTPKAGETYYVKEVPNNYLTPKSVCVWKHVNATNVNVTNFYVLTAVDSLKYQKVGFDVTNSTKRTDAPILDIGASAAGDNANNKVYSSVVAEFFNGSSEKITINNFKVSSGYFACHEVPSDYWQDAGDQITFHPYWVTLDGVKVSGVIERTCSYKGIGPDTGGPVSETDDTIDPEKYKKVGKIKDETRVYPMESVLNEQDAAPALFSLRVAPTAIIGNTNDPVDPVEPDPDPIVPDPVDPTECIVTVHDGERVYTESVEIGGDIELEYEGSLFAGWFTDPSFKNPADLSDIQSDIEVWAKYVSEDYLCTKYIEQGWFRVYGMTLISALDSDNYDDAGFIINGKQISCDYSESYGAFTARALFGSNVARGAKLMTYSLSLRNAKNGDKFEVTPYWVTLDGTTVYGTERTFTYNSRGIVG